MTDIATGSTCNHAEIPKNRIVKSDSSVVLVKYDGVNTVINPYKTSIYSSLVDPLHSLAWEADALPLSYTRERRHTVAAHKAAVVSRLCGR